MTTIRRMIVLGAGGDLAARLILPGLAGLLNLGCLPEGFRLIGLDRAEQDDEAFRAHVREAVDRFGDDGAKAGADRLAALCTYHRGDAGDPEALKRALGEGDGPAVIYLALPPPVFPVAIRAIAAAGLPEGGAIVVEKPFGQDLQSARDLNALLAGAAPERAIHRVDHFLEKQTVQNMLGLRFANRLFEPLWNREHIERVEIRWDEAIALEGRAGYYDHAGALRDMIQNHLLQVMALVAMEPPATIDEHDLRDRKVDLFRAVRTPTPEQIATQTVRARYTAGTANGRPVPDYAAEDGVDPANGTETFAEVTLHVDNWRWAGVPFTLRSGKALAGLAQGVTVHFRPVPHLAFGQSRTPLPNTLHLGLSPDRLELALELNGEGDVFDLEPVTMEAVLAPQEVSAYGRVILDVLAGDPMLAIRGDEAEECWRIVEPIVESWRRGVPELMEYPAGSDGPVAHGGFTD
ncbi:MAG: glucose-6-phosphate dehydrogenase [Thermoleophilia bacterium]